MSWKKGAGYRCPAPDCSAEIVVVRRPRTISEPAPRCCCGRTMKLIPPGARPVII